MFEHFKDKDCLLLCLPESCNRPAITSNFRFVRGDTSISTIARLKQQDEEEIAAAGNHKAKHNKHDKPKISVLYVFHRDELPFLANFTLDLSTNDEVQQGQVDHVIVKGMGVKGIGLTVRSWTNKCVELLGLGGKKEKKVKPQKADQRPRATTSESGNLPSAQTSDSHAEDESGRSTIQ